MVKDFYKIELLEDECEAIHFAKAFSELAINCKGDQTK